MENAAHQDEESVSEEIARIEKDILAFEQERQAREADVKRLRGEEDFAAGRFLAQEIFTAQQEALRIAVEIQMRRNKINRLRLGDEWQEKWNASTRGRKS